MAATAAKGVDPPRTVRTTPLDMSAWQGRTDASGVPLVCATLRLDTSLGERTALVLTPT